MTTASPFGSIGTFTTPRTIPPGYMSEWYKVGPQFDIRYVERPPVPTPNELALNKMYEEWLRKMEPKPSTQPAPYCCPLSHAEQPFPRLFESAEWVARTKVVDDGGVLHAWVAVSRPLFSRTSIVQNDQRLDEAREMLVAAGADPSAIRDYGWEEGKSHRHGGGSVYPHAICHLIATCVGEAQSAPKSQHSWLHWSQRQARKAGA